VLAEVDGLALLMDVVAGGLAATIQPGAATVRARRGELASLPLRDAAAQRPNFLVSLSDEELSPAALAARVVVRDVTRQLVQDGLWPGTTLHDRRTDQRGAGAAGDPRFGHLPALDAAARRALPALALG
jgi:LysR family transcriptional regulator, regulatory protein for tcuABC